MELHQRKKNRLYRHEKMPAPWTCRKCLKIGSPHVSPSCNCSDPRPRIHKWRTVRSLEAIVVVATDFGQLQTFLPRLREYCNRSVAILVSHSKSLVPLHRSFPLPYEGGRHVQNKSFGKDTCLHSDVGLDRKHWQKHSSGHMRWLQLQGHETSQLKAKELLWQSNSALVPLALHQHRSTLEENKWDSKDSFLESGSNNFCHAGKEKVGWQVWALEFPRLAEV